MQMNILANSICDYSMRSPGEYELMGETEHVKKNLSMSLCAEPSKTTHKLHINLASASRGTITINLDNTLVYSK